MKSMLFATLVALTGAAGAAGAQPAPAPAATAPAATGGAIVREAPAAAPPPARAARPAAPTASSAPPRPVAPTRAASAPTASRPARAGRANAESARAIDRLELDATQVTGYRELPKVMVVVPWKRSDIGDLVGKPVNSLVDEALGPVDREVFRREIDYFGALAPDRPAAARAENPVTAGANGARGEN